MKKYEIAIAAMALLLIAMNSGCRNTGSAEESLSQAPKRATVSDNGRKIDFPSDSPGLMQLITTQIRKGSATLSISAPARVVASVTSDEKGERVVLFESPDITSLYSSYRQSSANAARSAKNLARIKDMFENQSATGKDITDAENDDATAKASVIEMEGRLRALGFNPAELDSEPAGRVWLMADVPEGGIGQIHRDEAVSVSMNALPDRQFTGRAEAIGDIIDPGTRTVKVRIVLQNYGNRILPGMFAAVEFGQPTNSVILLPLSAVVTVDARNYVFVNTSPGEFQRREVNLENIGSTDAIVLKGVSAGEKLVTGGAMLLKGLSFGY